MHRWLFSSALPLVLGCSTDDNLFGEASGASSGTASTEGVGASPSSSSGGAEGPGAAGPGGGGPGPGPGPSSSSSGPGGGGNTGGASDGGGGSNGQGGGPTDAVGCSDGEREYFADVASQPLIAGCDAGFDEPGVITPNSFMPTCGRVSGDDSANPEGRGCSVEDACSKGWHVCIDASEVASHSATGACEPFALELPRFYVTRQVQDEQFPAQCTSGPLSNNLVGCGTLGDPAGPSCAPLARRMQANDCVPTGNWYCGNADNTVEAQIAYKVGSGEGGILCCKD